MHPEHVRWQRTATDHLVHPKIYRVPPSHRTAENRPRHPSGFWRPDHARYCQEGQVQCRDSTYNRYQHRRPGLVSDDGYQCGRPGCCDQDSKSYRRLLPSACGPAREPVSPPVHNRTDTPRNPESAPLLHASVAGTVGVPSRSDGRIRPAAHRPQSRCPLEDPQPDIPAPGIGRERSGAAMSQIPRPVKISNAGLSVRSWSWTPCLDPPVLAAFPAADIRPVVQAQLRRGLQGCSQGKAQNPGCR